MSSNPDRGPGAQDTTSIIQILSEEGALEILAAASQEPKSAKQLSEECGTSLATVYRRNKSLLEHGLLKEEVEVDESGNRYKVYQTNLNRIVIELREGYFDVDIQYTEGFINRLTRMFEGI